MSTRLRGLPALVPARAQLLILGSMPGVASLQAGCYYAHPRNLLWPLLGRWCGKPVPAATLAAQQAWLEENGLALWDVVGACERPGSLDSAIAADSVEANDLAALLDQYPAIHTLCFNGQAAWQLFRRHQWRTDPARYAGLTLLALPSTSPANAGQPQARKQQAWFAALAHTGAASPSEALSPAEVLSTAEAHPLSGTEQ